MSGVEYGIAQTLAYADDNTHGYELHSRDYSKGTDCAGLMRYYAAAVEGVAVSSYPDFGTWNQKSVMTARGWVAYGFSYNQAKRGDIFLRALGDATGHTVLYLGNGRIVGAEANKDGVAGDSSGREICEKAYYAYSYNWMLRPPSKFADSNTTSATSSATSTKHTSSSFAGAYVLNGDMYVRTAPNINGPIAAVFKKGKRLKLQGMYWVTHEDHNDGHGAIDWCWGTYVGVNTGTRYYICTGRYTGKDESDDFLTKVQ